MTTLDFPPAIDGAMPILEAPGGPILQSPLLGLAAEVVDDLERVRIANENRLRTLTDTGELGFGLTTHHPDVARLADLVERLRADEDLAVTNLTRVMRAHPLGPWCRTMAGVGEKQLARLLAAIGDPYWNDLHDRPRTVSELWAFCGFHVLHPSGQKALDTQRGHAAGVAPQRRKGVKGNWSETARKRAWLIAQQCMKTPTSPYRPFYDYGREKYADAVHTQPCPQCGAKGKPAQPGTPLRDGHKHARALRLVAKEVLLDLWLEAKALHEGHE